jgi:hypothetical protein
VHCSCRPSETGVIRNSLRLVISEMLIVRKISDSNFISASWELDALPFLEDLFDSLALFSSESLFNLGISFDYGLRIYCYYSRIFLDLILGDIFGYRATSSISSLLYFRRRSLYFFYISLITSALLLLTIPLWSFVSDCSSSASLGASFFSFFAGASILSYNMAYFISFLSSTLCLDNSGNLVLCFRLWPGYQIISFFSSCTICSLDFFGAGAL